jgi:membrane protease YdiL (CAAX protease family)
MELSRWFEPEDPRPLTEALLTCVPYLILFLLIQRGLARRGRRVAELLGPWPDASALRWTLEAAAAFLALSVAALFAVQLPLSYLAPGFVEDWILDGPSFIATSGEHRRRANVVTFAAAVVVGPFVEELLFRGLLLPAWAARWGVRKGILFSSLLFAVLHPMEPFGALLLAVVLAIAFLRSGTLWLPFFAHAVHNLLVYLWVALDLALRGEAPQTLAEFRSDWWWGVLGLILGAPLLARVLTGLRGIAPGR